MRNRRRVVAQEDVARDFTDWTFAGAIKASEGETPVAYSIGGLIGTMWPSGENNIISSTVTGQVTPDYSAAEVVGGLVGVVLDDDNGETNIVNNTVLSDHPMMGNVVGGLVGELEVDDNVNILNNRVVSSQTLGGTWLAGGLIGYIWNDATDEEIMLVDNNYASTTVSVDMSNGETNSAAGGLIGGAVYYSSGEISRLTIVNSFSAGTVSTPDYFAGGLVGAINTGIYGDVTDAEGSFIIRNSSSTADIIGGDGEHISVGGLLGGTYDVDYDDPIIPVPSGNIGGVTIHQSYATGNVTSESQSEIVTPAGWLVR